MLKNRIAIFGLVKWLAEKYIELEKQTLPHPCKLNDILYRDNKPFAQVQFSGQSHEVEIELTLIIEKNLFEYFSSEDKKTLFSSIYQKENLQLADYYHCHETEKEIIVLAHKETGHRMTLPLEIAAINNNLIEQISSNDANRIGFLSGIAYAKKHLNSSKGS
ncbi:MAG: hypothetical protein EPO11_03450 [Gammaproteobacteria bacterium]|nr:MAG: hypothetical protein EPO11_03450 [Gammaproteobacteria bacterium]